MAYWPRSAAPYSANSSRPAAPNHKPPDTAYPCGSWLACDADTSVGQANPGDAIAGKPAPTVDLHLFRWRGVISWR
ncbi:MAG TPA: hypothetical protein DIW86_06865 [Pseudomonas sp.]|nr:hypothetical protein [Pseudomonas sp.]